jgi:hypothetical protein
MALYEVVRVDTVKPGEFDSAFVIASGAARARAAVAHLVPEGAELMAVSMSIAKQPARVLSTYFDEREPVATEPTIPLF